ncbi:hypothetical protein LMG33818_001140 [Halomonadaceae bacterium LMG 33818]
MPSILAFLNRTRDKRESGTSSLEAGMSACVQFCSIVLLLTGRDSSCVQIAFFMLAHRFIPFLKSKYTSLHFRRSPTRLNPRRIELPPF